MGVDLDLSARRTALRWSWQDRLIGGQLNITGDEFSISKSFGIDTQTKLDARAALNLHTRRVLFSLRVRPFGRVIATSGDDSGLTIKQTIPIDPRLAVEYAGRVHLPEARFCAGQSSALSLGDGNFQFHLDQLNLRFLIE